MAVMTGFFSWRQSGARTTTVCPILSISWTPFSFVRLQFPYIGSPRMAFNQPPQIGFSFYSLALPYLPQVEEAPLVGGYDDKFVKAVEDDLQCSVCRLPLKDPMQTKCGHRFCRTCLGEHFKRFAFLINAK